jgi:hypothetical protein
MSIRNDSVMSRLVNVPVVVPRSKTGRHSELHSQRGMLSYPEEEKFNDQDKLAGINIGDLLRNQNTESVVEDDVPDEDSNVFQ